MKRHHDRQPDQGKRSVDDGIERGNFEQGDDKKTGFKQEQLSIQKAEEEKLLRLR